MKKITKQNGYLTKEVYAQAKRITTPEQRWAMIYLDKCLNSDRKD